MVLSGTARRWMPWRLICHPQIIKIVAMSIDIKSRYHLSLMSPRQRFALAARQWSIGNWVYRWSISEPSDWRGAIWIHGLTLRRPILEMKSKRFDRFDQQSKESRRLSSEWYNEHYSVGINRTARIICSIRLEIFFEISWNFRISKQKCWMAYASWKLNLRSEFLSNLWKHTANQLGELVI